MTVISSNPGTAHMEPLLSIRTAKGIDAPAIAELRALSSTGESPSRQFTASIRTWIETEGEPRITLMASAGGQPVGMISMLEYRGMPDPGATYSRWGHIGDLFVKQEERGQGVGTALIMQTIAIADRRDYSKLLVSPSSAGLSLFHRMGFVMIDELGPEGILLVRRKRHAGHE